MRFLRTVAALVAMVCLIGCGGNANPIKATDIQVGKSLNPDRTVAVHTTSFKPTDTIYTAVLTEGTGRATIGVRWLYNGHVISEPKKDVSYTGAAATEFHIQNSGGFPEGDYSVEVQVNGQTTATRQFHVQQ